MTENEVNDVMGGFRLTLVDALDTFVILGDKPGFERAVRTVIDQVHFDLDVRVQVFEVTIRMLGGLLSSHIFATDAKYGFDLPWYKGELLDLAYDLGKRLLPAFTNSPTGIPWARVNLARGHITDRNPETCSAAAGSLILEFATLSRLTGDPIFEVGPASLCVKRFPYAWSRAASSTDGSFQGVGSQIFAFVAWRYHKHCEYTSPDHTSAHPYNSKQASGLQRRLKSVPASILSSNTSRKPTYYSANTSITEYGSKHMLLYRNI